MLVDISGSPDPEAFRQTDIYRRCREMGIIPGSEAELESAVRTQHPDQVPSNDGASDAGRDSLPENTLDQQFTVIGMWCPACAWVIEESLLRQPGVSSARCMFATDRLHVHYDPVKTSPDAIVETISPLGYRLTEPSADAIRREKRSEFIRFGISAFLTMNVMMLSFSLYSGFFFELPEDAIWKLSWPVAVMATAVLVYGGLNMHRRGWIGIVRGAPGMESLVIIGADCAWMFSVFGLIRGSIHLYFDTAAMLITLVLLGKMLERKAKEQVQEDLASFFSLSPRKARICTDAFPDGRYVSVDLLEKDSIFRVDAGEVLPADGVVTGGEGTVNESSITGEATPLAKSLGDRVMSGTCVDSGSFKVKAERVGSESILGQMLEIMERSLGRKTAMEGRTDRLLRWFVPGILILAAGTGLGCFLSGLGIESAFVRTITVVVISCPCALGIAIPLARVAGISLAGRKGILVREFKAFEAAPLVKDVVLDKTGTLTQGRWALMDICQLGDESEAALLAMAAGLETQAVHPVAREIQKAAAARQISPAALNRLQSYDNGIAGIADGRELRIGSAAFMDDWLTSSEFEKSEERSEPGILASRVYLGVNGKLVGVLVFGDSYKENAKAAVSRLKIRGSRVTLISGDGETATQAAAEGLGIKNYLSGKLPVEKAAVIESLKSGGAGVAMVGDGVNDAPALAAADLGIAVYGDSYLSREAADITLMRGDPLQVLDFLELAGKVNRKISQNLFLTFVYNLVSIPVAISGLLNPLVAVTAMLLSSLSVTGNTLLLVKRES